MPTITTTPHNPRRSRDRVLLQGCPIDNQTVLRFNLTRRHFISTFTRLSALLDLDKYQEFRMARFQSLASPNHKHPSVH